MTIPSSAICCLVFAVGLAVAGEEGKSCEITVTAVTITCQDKAYIDNVELTLTNSGTKLICNNKGTITKELPSDAMCAGEFYVKEEEWKKSKFSMGPAPCCEMFKENEHYRKLAEKFNVPKECPVKEGSYNIENMEYDYAKKCEKMPKGEYKAVFSSNHTSGECLFSYYIIFTVA